MNADNIKFRSWVPKTNIMTGPYTLHELTNRYYGLEESFWIGIPDCFENLEADKSSIMRYIAIEDSAGKEIYEGDILEINPDDYVVVFNISEFAKVYDLVERGAKVVGNIYENPELYTKAMGHDQC